MIPRTEKGRQYLYPAMVLQCEQCGHVWQIAQLERDLTATEYERVCSGRGCPTCWDN